MDNNINVRNVLRVALYIRVSTQEQANEGYSVGEQTDRLKKYAEAMGWIVHKIYVDPGYSGGNTDRPGLKELIKDVKNGELDKVVVYKLDRLSRSQKDTLILIEDIFLANNVDFVSMSENFDTSTPIGRAVLGLLAVFAQLERDQIKERMGMGKEARAKEGKWHGGNTQPIGYDYNPSTDLLEVNEYEALQINELYDLFLSGMPYRTIETLFGEKGYKHKHGIWQCKTMKAVIQNPLNIGFIKHRDELFPGVHDPIVDKEKFDKAQELMAHRAVIYEKHTRKTTGFTTYLGGMLVCKHCGGKYAKQRNSRKGKPIVDKYMCYSRCKKSKPMIKDPNCKNKNWHVDFLDNLVAEEIKKLAVDPGYMDTLIQVKNERTDNPNKVEILNKEIAKLDEQISRFMDLYGLGKFTIDQVSNKIDPLNEQKSKLEKELDDLRGSDGDLTKEDVINLVSNFEELLTRGDLSEIRVVIESLIYYIELDNEDVYIHWKFA